MHDLQLLHFIIRACLQAVHLEKQHVLAIVIPISCPARLSCMTCNDGTEHDTTVALHVANRLGHMLRCSTPYQHSPKQVRIVGGVDAHDIPICCVILPGADDINPENAVHRCAP